MKAYQEAGVDLDAADETVERLKPLAKRTFRPEVMGGLGGFGGLFSLDLQKYTNPVLVSGTDGVGTKLKLAFDLDNHDTIGIDLVAMCVNDILVQGAEPLFFLDYFACGKLLPEQVEAVVKGISEGCLESGCALLGGETAEMPGMYQKGEYDLAGFTVGAVNKEQLVDGSKIKESNVLLGLASSGIHSNGFSLIRKILKDHSIDLSQKLPGSSLSVGQAMLIPTKLYVKSILKLLDEVEVHGMAHITGGGLQGNVPRMLPKPLDETSVLSAQIDKKSWPELPIYTFIKKQSALPDEELFPVFNMGIGFVICLSLENVEKAVSILEKAGESVYQIGQIVTAKKPEITWL